MRGQVGGALGQQHGQAFGALHQRHQHGGTGGWTVSEAGLAHHLGLPEGRRRKTRTQRLGQQALGGHRGQVVVVRKHRHLAGVKGWRG